MQMHISASKQPFKLLYAVGRTVLRYKNLAKAVLSFPSKIKRDIDQIIPLMVLLDALLY